MNQNSYFVSDLHLFSRRSVAAQHSDVIHAAAGNAATFVLGGDIFDFRWTTMASIEQTVDAAIEWLQELIEPRPDCDFHFLLGNHDNNRMFVQRLAELSRETANLSWHPYYVRLGESLFLHGDVVDRKTSPDKLARARSRSRHHKKRGATANLLYDLAVGARLHQVAATVVHPKRKVAKRILVYCRHIGHDASSGLRNVYFGHTHVAMLNYQYGGLFFHNGGAPIKGLPFRIVPIDVSC
jgi:UDP-2,3-diacylglucosamine hydrolase